MNIKSSLRSILRRLEDRSFDSPYRLFYEFGAGLPEMGAMPSFESIFILRHTPKSINAYPNWATSTTS